MNFKKIVMATLIGVLVQSSVLIAGELQQGDKIKVITPNTVARLCPYPNCGGNEHLTRIPEGTVLIIEGITEIKAGLMAVKWLEVKYKDKKGWISIYDTDKQ